MNRSKMSGAQRKKLARLTCNTLHLPLKEHPSEGKERRDTRGEPIAGPSGEVHPGPNHTGVQPRKTHRETAQANRPEKRMRSEGSTPGSAKENLMKNRDTRPTPRKSYKDAVTEGGWQLYISLP